MDRAHSLYYRAKDTSMHYVDPTREQFKDLFGLSLTEPVHMLNLIRFRDIATYREGTIEATQPPITGRQAYGLYSAASEPLYRGIGGRQIWIGKGQLTLVGPDTERWDLVFVAFYPTAQAFIDMVKTPEYQQATRHRTAGVVEARLIRCAALTAGTGFAPADYGDSPSAGTPGR